MIRTGSAENETLPSDSRRPAVSWWWLAPWVLALAALPFVWRPLWKLAASFSAYEGAAAGAPAAASAPSPLGFSATHEGSDWRLVWNRDALTRLGALGAMLTIRDGGVDRLQFLSPQDLAGGAIFYVPRTSDLTFNFKVTVANGPDLEEQIRVLGAVDGTQMARSIAPRRFGESARESAAAEGIEPAPQKVAATRQFQPPPSTPVVKGASLDAAVPDVRLPAASPLRIEAAPLPPPAPPKASTPPAPAGSAPASPARAVETPRPAPPVIARTEAVARRPVSAAWPRNVSRNTNTEVRIRVQIDSLGRVAGATPVQRTVSNYPFVDSALTAARLWTFTPATENGKPVPTETVLIFKFTP